MRRVQPLALALSLALAYPAALALPQGGQVVQGQVALSPGLIQQGSDKAIVNWQSFSIAAGETLRVQQPGVNSVLLNRVVGGDPSLILGQLQANGRVFLVNPRGIVFGRGSQVDAGGLVASTLDLSDTDFTAGIYRFTASRDAGTLQADGRISAPGGTVALVAPQLDVAGSIEARRVGLAAGSTVQVDVEGDGLVLFNLRNDDSRDVSLRLAGRVLADGGSAELRAQARAGAAGQVLNMDGVVQARGLRQQGGRIVIDGGTAGITQVSGQLDATGEAGGDITVLGQKLALLDAARVDASGRLGGGRVQLGGGFEGLGTSHTAERTWIGAGAEIRADAGDQGDGGRIAVWAEQRTDMLGRISARGGRLGGNGGLVETSARGQLNVAGQVDAGAPKGSPGQWLLDPNDIVIKANGNSNVNVGAAPDFLSTDDAAIVDVGALNTALAGGTTVRVQTQALGTNAQSGNIDVQAAIVPTGAAALHLTAAGHITFSSGSIAAGGRALDVVLKAGGNITGSTINTGGGDLQADASGTINLGTVTARDLVINGGAGTVTLPSGSLSGLLTVNTSGAISQGGALTVGAAASLTTANAPVTLGSLDSHGLSVTTTGGAITLGTGTVQGNLSATSGGGLITQAAGGLVVTGGTSLGAGAGSILLTESNDLQDTVTLSGATAQLINARDASRTLKLGASTLTGSLTATTGGGDIVQGGTLSVGGTALLQAAGGSISLAGGSAGVLTASTSGTGAITQAGSLTASGAATLTSGSGGVALGSFNSQRLDITATGGGVVLGSGTVSGALTVDSGGTSISQTGTGLTVTGTSQLDAGSGTITLALAGNDLQDTVTVTGGATQLVSSKTASSVLKLGSGNVGGTFSATTGGGAITQTGTLAITGNATLEAAGGAITLARLDSADFTAHTSGGPITLGTGTVSGVLSAVSGGGTIDQAAGGLVVTGNATVNAGAGAVTLADPGNDWRGTVNLRGGTSQLRSTLSATSVLTLGTVNAGSLTVRTAGGALNLGSGTIAGALDARSFGGDITQAGALSVSGVATLNATTNGNITLADTLNQWNGLHLTGNTLDVRSGGDITVLSLTQPVNRALTLSAGGNLALGPAASIDTGNADLTLASLGGSFAVGGVLKGRNISLQAQSGLTLSNDLTATGNLTLATASGGITQSTGQLTVTGSTTVTAGTSGITLNSTGNDFTGAVSLTGGTTAIRDGGALTLGALSTGALTVRSDGLLDLGQGIVTGTLNANSGGFAVTQASGGGVRLKVTGTSTLAAGIADITLMETANDFQGAITATGGGVSLHSAGNLHLTALTQPGNRALVLEAAGTLTLPAGTTSIDTGSAALTLSSGAAFATLDTLKGGNITLKGITATLAHDITASGNLDVRATAGGINQTGGRLSVQGTTLLSATGGTVVASRPLNSFQDAVTLAGTSAQVFGLGTLTLAGLTVNNLTAQSGGAMRLGTGTLSGNLTATAGGAITQASGGLRVAGLAGLTASGPITLLDAANDWTGSLTLSGGAVQLKGSSGLALNASSVNSLALTAGGAVTQGGALSVTGTASVDAGTSPVTLAHGSNQFGGALTLTGGATRVTAQGPLALGVLNVGDLTLQSGGALQLGQGGIGGDLVASASGNVTQGGALNVGGTASVQAGSASITLNNGGNHWGGAVSLTGGTTQLSSNAGLTLGTLAVGALTVRANGPLGLGAGTVGGALDADSQAGAITQAGALDVTGPATLHGGSLTLTQANNRWRGVVHLAGGSAQVTGSGALRLGTLGTGSLTAISTGPLDLGQGAVAGNLVADSGGGAITQTGALDVTGNAAFTATGADITLTQTGNRFLGALSLTGNAVAIFNQPSLAFGTLSFNSLDATSNGSISLGTGTLGGNLTARALGGDVTQSAGGLTVNGSTTLQASGAITLADAANRLQGLVNLDGGTTAVTTSGALRLGSVRTGALTVRSTGALDLGTARVGGALVATSAGALTQVGALSVAGTSSLDAGSAPITLTQAGNAFTGAVSLRGGVTQVSAGGALSLGSLGVAELTVQSGGALQLGTGRVAGTLVARSGGSPVTQAAGGLSVGASATVEAGSSTVLLGDAANAFSGLVHLNAGDVTLANAGALQLGHVTAHDFTVSAGGDLDLGSSQVSGNLAATTRGTRISQAGALHVTGTAGFIADGSLVDLVLDNPGNQLLGAIQMRGINGGSFLSASFSTSQDLSFSGDVQTLTLSSGGRLTLGGGRSQTLTAKARTGIVQTGVLEVSGQTTLVAQGGAGMAVDLAQAGNDLHAVTLKADSGGSLGRVQLREADATRHDGLQVAGDAAALEITSAGALTLGGGRYSSLSADTAAGAAAIKQTAALNVSGTASLQAGGGDITLDRADNQLPNLRVASAGTARLASQGDYTVDAGLVATQLALAGPGAIALTGRLSGTGELLMAGSGSLTLSTAHDHSGGTRIDAGRLVLQGAGAQPGSGAVQLGAAGALDLRDGAVLTTALVAQGGRITNTSGNGTLAGPVTLQATTPFAPGAAGLAVTGAIGDNGAGFGVELAGPGTLTLSGPNDYRGSTRVTGGTLFATGPGALPATSAVELAAGATLALGADQAIGSLAGAGRVSLDRFTLATGADGGDTTFTGTLAGSGGLTKLGAGRFTLAGSSTHAGATQVAAGELVLASATALNEATAVTVDAGAQLTVAAAASLGSLAGAGTVDVQSAQLAVGANDASTRWAGTLQGAGGLAKRGTGTFTLAGGNTLAGDVAVQAGTLLLEGAGVRPLAAGLAAAPVLPATAGVAVDPGATLASAGDIDLGALSGAGLVQLGSHVLTLGASGRSSRFDGTLAGAGSLVKAGSGTFTLGGANTYTGGTRVSDGLLVAAANQALPTAGALTLDSAGRVQIDAAQSVGSLAGSGSLVLNGADLATGSDGRDSRFDGVASGTGGLVKQGAGTLVLTAASTHSGANRIEAGAVTLAAQGRLGSGDVFNDGQLVLSRTDAMTLDAAVSGRGSLVVTAGEVTLANAANRYTGATQVLGGVLRTTAAERLPDASAVQVAAGAQLDLGGAETVASLQAAGSVRLAGNFTTQAEQVYTGSLTLANPAGLTLAGSVIDASRSSNQFGSVPLGLSGGQALLASTGTLVLGDVTLAGGGRIEAGRLQLDGRLQLGGGALQLVATAAPEDAKATLLGTAQVPVAGQPLALAEATVQQGAGSAITVAEGASLQVTASGGGSVLLTRDANSFRGALAVLSGSAYDTAWAPNVRGAQAVQSQVSVAGSVVNVGGAGLEADLVHVRADQLATSGSAALVARLPFDEIVLGRALSAPGLTLELAPGAFGVPGSFGAINGQAIQVAVGSTATGARTVGPNAGYVTVLPKGGAQGATAVVLVGPKVGSVPASGGAPYRFFHDGASRPTEIPVVYNGVLPLTPAATGALSSINGDAEDARRARFQDTVRTENVTVRLRAGVIAEVGPGRASTQGSEGARPPELCDPADKPALSCKPPTPLP